MDSNCECVEVEGELHFPPPDWKRPLPLHKCDVDEGVWLRGEAVRVCQCDPVMVVVVAVAMALAVSAAGV